MDNYYSTRYSPDKNRTKVWRAICEYLQKYIINAQDTVLDLGSGYCDFINQIQARVKIAVDLNPVSKYYCSQDVIFYCSSVINLDQVIDESVDVVFSSNLLEHLFENEISILIGELKRIMKNGSRIILIQPNYRYAYKEYFDDYTHKKIFTHVSLNDLFTANGFKLLSMEKKFLPLTIKSLFPKSYWLTKLYILFPYRPMAKQMLLVFEKFEPE